MDKSIILAVAGSGKTSSIINRLDENKRTLIITYTNNNFNNLRLKTIKRFGYLPPNIKIYTYFTFLYSFCYKPFLFFKYRTKGINYKSKSHMKAKGLPRYLDKYGRLYHYRISKFLEVNKVQSEVNNRIQNYFDNLFIDEIQDFAGNDFNFIKNISKINFDILYVGDFYQHTFDTSHDGNVNASLHDDYIKYQKQFETLGFNVDLNSLIKSYRCSPTVCNFITRNLGIKIESRRTSDSEVIFVSDKNESQKIIASNDIHKLFLKEHYKFNCLSINWGESKGIDHFEDVCVVLNKKTEEYYKKDKLIELSAMVKNKLYVACSRARNNLYILSGSWFERETSS
jgi:DNA helicase II / ATP-dependent DNA helicase PcrA